MGCPSGWTLMPDELRCIQVTSNMYTGPNAEAHCQTLTIGGHLVRISSSADNTAVSDLALDELGALPGGVWIGLNDQGSEGVHVWYDGGPVDYLNWQSGQPNNSANSDCVSMRQDEDGGWNDEQCPRSLYAVCQTPAIIVQ